MTKRVRTVRTVSTEVHSLRGKREGAVLKDQVWYEDGKVIAYNLVYVNLKVFPRDNGRVLGYDNSHGYHHRHFMGKVESIEYTSYEELAQRFIEEVHELWRIEDEED